MNEIITPEESFLSVYERWLALWNVYPEVPLRALKDLLSYLDFELQSWFLKHLRGLYLRGFVAWNSSSDPDMCCTYSWNSLQTRSSDSLRCRHNSWCNPANGDEKEVCVWGQTFLDSNLSTFTVNPFSGTSSVAFSLCHLRPSRCDVLPYFASSWLKCWLFAG